MSKERELLERCLRRFYKSGYECSQLVEDIENYLANANPSEAEPVAWMFFSTKGRPHYHLNEYQALEGLQMYGGDKVIALYEHPAPRKEFVRLSQEEIQTIYLTRYDTPNLFARAIEDALEERNK